MTNTAVATDNAQFRLTINIPAALIRGIFQNSDIAYWATTISQEHNGSVQVWSQKIVCDDTGETYLLTYEKVVKGYKKLCRDYVRGKKGIDGVDNPFSMLRDPNEYDSSFGDNVVQYCLFGKIVYG